MKAAASNQQLRIAMKRLDEACAWLIFLAGVSHIVFLEIYRWRGVLDTGLLYIFVAMFNLLRIRSRETTRLILVFCLGANVAALLLEILRWSQWMRWYTVAESLHFGLALKSLAVLILLFLETAGSIAGVVGQRLPKSGVGGLTPMPEN